MATRPLIGYARVSTATQGRSGLGVQAQQEALTRFAHAEDFELVRVFVEVETAKAAMPLNAVHSLPLRWLKRDAGGAQSAWQSSIG